jgi:SSS family solute:Na+ symporter
MTPLDGCILAIYAATVVALGMYAGRQERNTEDFFLAGRRMTWLPVAVSSIATSLSALTFIGVPGAAYGGNWGYLQLVVGNVIGAYILARLFFPRFYQLKVTTVYELLGHRFGPITRSAGTVFFIGARILASAVRLAGCAIAVSVFFGIELKLAIFLIATFAVLYTATGGIKAVIYTDALQLGLFMLGALLVLIVIIDKLPGGFSHLVAIGDVHGKFDTFNWDFNLSDPSTFWAGNVFAIVIGLAVGATDQDIAQRSLTCRNVKEAQKAAIVAGASSLLTYLAFLSVGTALFAYYQVFPDAGQAQLIADKRADYVFPYFILHALPSGVRGLLVAGLLAAAMSSLDSALNGLASTAYVDLYSRNGRAKNSMLISRVFVVLFAVILAVVAALFGQQPSILWFGLKIMGWTYGALLGIFLLAVLTKKRGNEYLNVAAMLSSVFVVLVCTAQSGVFPSLRSALHLPAIAWPWAIVIGTTWTFGVGALGTRGKKAQA